MFRNTPRKAKKQFRRKVFVVIRHVGGRLVLGRHCWEHSHPMAASFLDCSLRPDSGVTARIRTMTSEGRSAADIRRSLNQPIPARMLYDIRRPILRDKRSSDTIALVAMCSELRERWDISLHYKNQKQMRNSPDELVQATFVSRHFLGCGITRDILQLDDIQCTNLEHMPIVNV